MIHFLILFPLFIILGSIVVQMVIELGVIPIHSIIQNPDSNPCCANSRSDTLQVFFTALLIRLFVLLLAIAFIFLLHGNVGSLRNALNYFNRWDSQHYINLFELGYAGYDESGRHLFLVFFPFYVWIVRFVRIFVSDTLVAGMLVSSLSFAWGCCWVHKIAIERYSKQVADDAIVLLSFFPFSFFFGTVMTEGLFLLTTAAATYYALKHKWALYAFWGVLAALTRMTGLLVIVPGFVELLKQFYPIRETFSVRQFKQSATRLLIRVPLICMPCLGTLAYLFLNYYIDGNLFAFKTHQQHWSQGPMLISSVIKYIYEYAVSSLGNSIAWVLWLPELALFFIFIIILITAITSSFSPTSLLLYGFFYLTANYSLSWLLSGGRYLSCGFMFFIFLADMVKNVPKIRLGIVVMEVASLCIILAAYLSGMQVM